MNFIVQRWERFVARRDERRAFRRLGEALPASAEVSVFDEKIAGYQRVLSLSLPRDRADWLAVPVWARWLVVLRGVFERLVLRALVHRARQERAVACERLGAQSLEGAKGYDAELARVAHARVEGIAVDPLPLWVTEAAHLARFVAAETRGQLLPRAPALVGLWVGWWIAQTFTDSGLSATLHAWGFGSGPRHAVRSETLHAMSFWLPLLAAAVTSYAGSRLGALIRRRYAPEATSAAGSSAGTA